MTKEQGYKSGFILRPKDPEDYMCLRFFVREHEMSTSGHATIGALWVLRTLACLPPLDGFRIKTPSGLESGLIANR